jgi:hypothetical protein
MEAVVPFRLLITTAQKTKVRILRLLVLTGFLEWNPVVTGELICSMLGLPIVLTGVGLLCKAYFKELSYGSIVVACLKHQEDESVG